MESSEYFRSRISSINSYVHMYIIPLTPRLEELKLGLVVQDCIYG